MKIKEFFEQAENSEKVPELILSFKRTKLSAKRLDTTEKQVAFLQKAFDPGTFDIREESILLILNEFDQPVCFYRLAKGTTSSVSVPYNTLFGTLLALHAHGFVLAHNHPHRNPMPSFADVKSAHDISLRATMFGLNYIDDIIISRLEDDDEENEVDYPAYFSLRDNGLIFDGDFEE